MAGPWHGHLPEFPLIRVDCFTEPKGGPYLIPSINEDRSLGPLIQAPRAQVFLLTHVHSDHLTGLKGDNFHGQIICTPDSKRMLLKLQAEKERKYMASGIKEENKLKYSKLAREKRETVDGVQYYVDRIRSIEYGETIDLILGYEDGKPLIVSVTAFDANHCPGSAMFLITTPERAILHTGDIRADYRFLDALKVQSHPALKPFLTGERTLDRINLDTSAFIGTEDMPHKDDAIRELVDQIAWFPKDTVFFFNIWTWGWEDVIKRVSSAFDQPVCVDRYKHSVYRAIHDDPDLLDCTTLYPSATRFHACERYARCAVCRGSPERLVVTVTMSEVKDAAYELFKQDIRKQVDDASRGEYEWPKTLMCPVARHSPLPELQALVKLFKPRSLSPNTLQAMPSGLEYFALPELLGHCLTPTAAKQLERERDQWYAGRRMPGITMLDTIPFRRGDADVNPEQDLSSPVGCGRKAAMTNHMSRVGIMLGNVQESFGDLPPGIGERIVQAMGAGVVLAPPRSVIMENLDEGYDTDEERRTARRPSRAKMASSAIHSTNAVVGVANTASDLRPVARLKEGLVKDDPSVIKTRDAKWSKSWSTTPRSTSESVPRAKSPFLKERKFSRASFAVDRAHLRALIAVACPDGEEA
ncbi:beta-lactamase-like protein [Kockovaella imperatae]|uniref:Beta-lactamase-like protein n=1 Tax=Kockovaella imperatae TaxID=4999 RepID=A0A1Y1UCE4_9TREE|nr:beta-lactamase-like protein [Kockovaella imperatae]ORX34745.1 beta-lactamase-like protein [Kockovaella imperatae]